MGLFSLSPQDEDVQLGPHFNSKEFRCVHCDRLSIDLRLIDYLERLRSEINTPIIITSGYRCPFHNKQVHGAKHSRHLITDAADIYAKNMNIIDLYMVAYKIFPRVGLYDSNFIHVDIYKTKGNLYWVRIKGQYTYFKDPESAVIFFNDRK